MPTEYHREKYNNAYNKLILQYLHNIDKIANGNKSKFIYYFNLKVKQRIINDPKIIQRK